MMAITDQQRHGQQLHLPQRGGFLGVAGGRRAAGGRCRPGEARSAAVAAFRTGIWLSVHLHVPSLAPQPVPAVR